MASDNRRPGSGTARAMLVLSAFMWGLSFAVTKDVLDEVTPAVILAYRYTLASLVMLPLVVVKRKTMSLISAARGLAIGFLSSTAYISQNVGLQYTTASKSSFLTMVYCILTPFVYWIIAKKRTSGFDFAAAALCMTGIAFLSLNGNFSISMGDSLTLISGVVYAVQIVLIGLYCEEDDPFCLTFFMVSASAVSAWTYKLLSEGADSYVNAAGWRTILYLALCCTVAAFAMQNWAQKIVPPSETALLVSLESVFGVIGSVVILHDAMSPRLVTGFVLIFISMITSQTHFSFLKGPYERFRNRKRS